MAILDKFSLEGKIALVTGASYGIGFAIATAYAEAGATIVFNDIKQELVDKGLAAYEEKGIKAHGYVCDVTDEEQVNELVAKIEKEVGVIDILVNNAGIIKRIPMCEMKASEFRQVIDVDLNAPFIVSKAVIPSMIKKGHGKIINIRCIEKDRYGIIYSGHFFEIDFFKGDNEGLCLAEVELFREGEEIELPDFIIKEVTDDPKYYNKNLYINPYKNWNNNG